MYCWTAPLCALPSPVRACSAPECALLSSHPPPPLELAPGDHPAPALGAHAAQEAVPPLSDDQAGLEGALGVAQPAQGVSQRGGICSRRKGLPEAHNCQGCEIGQADSCSRE